MEGIVKSPRLSSFRVYSERILNLVVNAVKWLHVFEFSDKEESNFFKK